MLVNLAGLDKGSQIVSLQEGEVLQLRKTDYSLVLVDFGATVQKGLADVQHLVEGRVLGGELVGVEA